jgi:hypothetical protein
MTENEDLRQQLEFHMNRSNLFQDVLAHAASLGHAVEEWLEHCIHHKHHEPGHYGRDDTR